MNTPDGSLPKAEVSAILNGLADPVLFLSLDAKVVGANLPALRLLDYTAEAIEGLPLERLLQCKSLAHLLSQRLLTGRFKNFHTQFRSRLGETLAVSLTNTVLHNAQDAPVGVVLTARDFGEMEQLYGQLVQSAKMTALGHMAAGIAHEINNPLTSVLALCELNLEMAQEPDLQADLEAMRDQAVRIKDVVQRLLELARSQADMRYLEVNLNDLLHSALGVIGAELHVGRISLELELGQQLGLTLSDPHHLRQVLVNLLVNACKAMPEGGTLTVRTFSIQDRLCAQIEDTGVGISPENLERIFDPFYTTRAAGQGTGLGLALCQTIMRGLGGEITVTSVLGQGSKFTVQLPFLHPAVQELGWQALQSAQDRRTTVRVDNEIEVQFSGDQGEIAVLTQDLGAGGLRVFHNQNLDDEQEYLLKLQLGGEFLEVWSRVAWQRYDAQQKRHEIGFQFLRMTDGQQQRLVHYLDAAVASGSPLLGRRRFSRVPRLMFLDVRQADDAREVTSGVVLDLSGTGAKILCSRRFEPGTRLTLHLELQEGTTYELACVTRWSTLRSQSQGGHRHLHGVEFEQFAPDLQAIIDQYLADRAVLRQVDVLEGLRRLLGGGENL